MLSPEEVKVELARLAAEREAIATEYERRMEVIAQKIKENPALGHLPLPANFGKPDPITGRHGFLSTK